MNGRRTIRFQKTEIDCGRDVHFKTTGGKETGGTVIYGSSIHRPRKGIRNSSKRYGHDHVEVDGCPRGGGENGRRNI